MEKLDDVQIKNIVETLLFVTDSPVSLKKLSEVTQIKDKKILEDSISQLKQEYADSLRATQIVEIAGGYQISTKPEYGRWVRKLYKEKLSAKLSAAGLETLSIIAYRQPITRAEIEEVRGVDTVGPLETLIERDLVKVVGKRDTAGKPMIYGVTDRFLRQFGLNSVEDLPELSSFEQEEEKAEQQELFTKPKDVKIFNDEGELVGSDDESAENANLNEDQPEGQDEKETELESKEQDEQQTQEQDGQSQQEQDDVQEEQHLQEEDETEQQEDVENPDETDESVAQTDIVSEEQPLTEESGE